MSGRSKTPPFPFRRRYWPGEYDDRNLSVLVFESLSSKVGVRGHFVQGGDGVFCPGGLSADAL